MIVEDVNDSVDSFGAVLEDFEVTDAMNDICAKYGL